MTNGSNRPVNPDVALPGAKSLGDTTEFFVSRPTREPVPDATFGFLSSAFSGTAVQVVEARVHESLEEPYEAVVELCTSDTAVDFESLLGLRCAIEIVRGPRTRRLCGVARRVERLDSWGGLRRARVVLVPAMWALARRSDSRIYQDLDTIEVVKAVFDEAGLEAPTVETQREYPKREYCVQYRETDLAFVTRLLEEEGIVLYFRHDRDVEVAVLADSPSYGLCPTIDRRAVPFSPPQAEQAPVEVVQRLDFARELRSTGFMGRDYDFTRPLASLDMTKAQPRGDQGLRPRYEYPARFVLGPYDEASLAYGPHDGAHRVGVRHGEEQSAEGVGVGTGNVTGFVPGRVFQLLGHEHGDLDRQYLLTRVVHHLRAPEALLTDGAAGRRAEGIDRYRNEFHCIPADVPYLPTRRTPRPMVLAAQTAVVSGKGDEEIHVDAHGRIKVQFHWDRKGRHDEHTSCWIRVAQTWAGPGWGFQFIPRVGMEVVVTFLEGDPDRPLVTGCVYNGVNRPPYELPAMRTVSTIKSNSSPGGCGFNELRFEDQKGAEEVYLHAERDHREDVGHDQVTAVARNRTLAVGGERAETIGGDHTEEIGGSRTEAVVGDHSERTGGSRTVAVAGAARETVGGSRAVVVHGESRVQVLGNSTAETGADGAPRDWDVFAWGDCTLGSDRRVYLRAERGIELRCGNSVIEITKNGIKIESSNLTLAGTKSATLSGKGPALSLGDEAELVAKSVRVVSSGASLALDDSAHLDGAEVKLNCKGADRSRKDAEGNPPPTQHLSMKLTDEEFNPIGGKEYVLVAKGARYEGTLRADGGLELDLPADAQAALLTVWMERRPTGRSLKYHIKVGEVAPVAEVAGAQARLRNLGYLSGGSEGAMDDATRSAVTEFQRDHDLEQTGELNDATRSKLQDVHGH